MSLADRWAETIYRMATARGKLKIIMTPAGIIFCFGLSVLFIYASLWLDKFLPVLLSLPIPANIFLPLPVVVIGATLVLWPVYSFIRARGSLVPFNPPQRLGITGLYSRVRNPMIAGWMMVLIGLGLLLNSVSLIFISTSLFILLNVLYLKTIEEKGMEKKFGQQYLRYKKNVSMFIPRFSKSRVNSKGQ